MKQSLLNGNISLLFRLVRIHALCRLNLRIEAARTGVCSSGEESSHIESQITDT